MILGTENQAYIHYAMVVKNDRLKPVITLTIYFGAEDWDAPRSLYKMFKTKNPEILKYVNDYKLNLIVLKEVNVCKGMIDFERTCKMEGIEEGRREGREEGRREERENLIKKNLKKGRTPEEIEEITGYLMEEILAVEDELFAVSK
jgi:hypothetical protein